MVTTGMDNLGKTWDPLIGCTKVSDGCKNCYAETLIKRLQATGNPKFRQGFKLTLHPDELLKPYQWKKTTFITVNSLSDLFHPDVPLRYIKRVFRIMNENQQHIFRVLTKRSATLKEISRELNWTPNIWMGVSVENQKVRYRIDDLRSTGAFFKFLSLEPLLGPLPNLNLQKINWVTVAAESGPDARPIKKEWIEDIKNQCLSFGTAFSTTFVS